MLKRSFIKESFYLPLTLVFLMFTSYVWQPGYVIAPGHMPGFFEYTEMTITVLLAACCCFVLTNKFEIELALVCNTSTLKLFMSKVIPIFIYTIIPMFVVLLMYEAVPYTGNDEPVVPIFIPENWKLYAGLSILVSFVFFFALFCFLRVLCRNCYLPILLCMFFHALAYDTTKNIQYGSGNIAVSIINPYISVYMLGDKVGNELAQSQNLAILQNVWTYNRILFAVLSVILVILTIWLLKRENLHKGFGD